MAAKLHRWHRRIGLAASLFIAFLVITGILIQHSDTLNFPSTYLSNTWLLKYYGIKPNPITTYQLHNRTVSHAGGSLYFSGKPININKNSILGAVELVNGIVIATENSLLLLNKNGEIIDEITLQNGLAEAPLGISKSDQGNVVVRGINKYWEGNQDLTKWQVFSGPHPEWTAPSITLPALRQVIESHDMSQQISLERFLLDAHSGRFFGKYGVYIIDVAAILMLILAITGIWLWSVRR